MRRILLTGLVVAASVTILVLVGDTLGLTTIRPLVLAAGAGLMFGVPRLRHALALLTGAGVGLVSTTAAASLLPATPAGDAIGVGAALLLVTVVAAATRMRLPFGLLLIGWAVMTGLLEPLLVAGPNTFSQEAPLTAAALLVSIGLGLLVAQVAALVGRGLAGRTRPHAAGAALALALVVGAVVVPSGASAQEGAPQPTVGPARVSGGPGDVEGDVRTLQHHQLLAVRGAADGTLGAGTVVTQLHATGEGSARVTLRDQAIGDLRLVSGFGRLRSADGAVTYALDLRDGAASVRSIADLDRALPVRIEVTYQLDGVAVAPSQLVGRTGRVSATLTVTNLTSELREVRSYDGQGRARVELRDVAVPLVGTLVVALDDRFTDVRSDDATAVVADGRGGARIEAELALFEPVGGSVRTVTWSADVRDGVAPPVSIRLVPLVIADTPPGRARITELEDVADGARAIADGGALLRTSLAAIDLALDPADATGPILSAQMAAVLDEVIAGAVESVALQNADLALLAAQDDRRRAGDGLPYGVLAGAASEDVSVVLAIELDGLGADPGPSLPLRLTLGLVVLGIVGLLGRPISVAVGQASRS